MQALITILDFFTQIKFKTRQILPVDLLLTWQNLNPCHLELPQNWAKLAKLAVLFRW